MNMFIFVRSFSLHAYCTWYFIFWLQLFVKHFLGMDYALWTDTFATGWGVTEYGSNDFSTTLRKFQLMLVIILSYTLWYFLLIKVSNVICQFVLGTDYDKRGSICAVGTAISDTCKGSFLYGKDYKFTGQLLL